MLSNPKNNATIAAYISINCHVIKGVATTFVRDCYN